MSQSLSGKIALVTGGTAGIGRAIALRFAQEGADVVIFGQNAERGAKVVEELQGANPQANAQFFQVNVADTASVKDAMEAVLKEKGQLDVLVNNAGITRDNLLMKCTEEDWDTVLDTNLKSVFNTCHSAVRPMLRARKGVIINITSVVGLTGNPGQGHYAASKAGIIGFSKSLAKELARKGIRVNCLAPGLVQTAMTDKMADKAKEVFQSAIPMGRAGQPEDIANVAAFLAGDDSSYMTGQVLTVDGGMAM